VADSLTSRSPQRLKSRRHSDRKNAEPASSSSPFWSGPACPPGSPTPSTTPAGTANCGRKLTRRSRWPARTSAP